MSELGDRARTAANEGQRLFTFEAPASTPSIPGGLGYGTLVQEVEMSGWRLEHVTGSGGGDAGKGQYLFVFRRRS